MPDMNYSITVDLNVTVSGFPAIKGKFPINVNALTACAPWITEIKGTKEERATVTAVPFLPTLQAAPEFVMVCPVNDKGEAIPLEEGALEYSIYYQPPGDGQQQQQNQQQRGYQPQGDQPGGQSDDQEKHRKPIRGAHVLFNGAVEWMTDLRKGADSGTRYDLNTLYFWNNTRKPIKVQIVVGFSAA